MFLNIFFCQHKIYFIVFSVLGTLKIFIVVLKYKLYITIKINNYYRLSNILCLMFLSSFIMLHFLLMSINDLFSLRRLSINQLISDTCCCGDKNCKYALKLGNPRRTYFYYMLSQKKKKLYLKVKLHYLVTFGVNIPT